MTHPTGKSFRFNEDEMTLREEIVLTDKQVLSVRHSFESSLFLSAFNPENIHVYGAPEFLSYKSATPSNSKSNVSSCSNPFVNIAKSDLRDFGFGKFMFDSYRQSHLRRRRLFALSCGHYLCRTCWRMHCLGFIAREICPIPCPNGYCKEKLTIGRAAVLLNDAAIKTMITLEWRNQLRLKDTLRCAGCRRWIQRSNIYSQANCAACACGCYTCIGCGKLDHTPLRCNDAVTWNDIRSKENEDESAAAAKNIWALTGEDFDECLIPSKVIARDQFKKNLRFMKTNDPVNGKLLEKAMPMVARMLEMRRVQQLANRREIQTRADDVHGDECNLRWSSLETHFVLALDTVGETRLKAAYLDNCRRHVLSYYEENFT